MRVTPKPPVSFRDLLKATFASGILLDLNYQDDKPKCFERTLRRCSRAYREYACKTLWSGPEAMGLAIYKGVTGEQPDTMFTPDRIAALVVELKQLS